MRKIDMSHFCPSEHHAALMELAPTDWAQVTPLERQPFGGQLRRRMPENPSPRVHHLLDQINAFSQSTGSGSDLILALRTVGLALHEGPKVYCPASETCEALRHVGLEIQWQDFKIPFRHLIVQFPHEWAAAHAHSQGLSRVPSACILASLQPDYFAAIVYDGQEEQHFTLNNWHLHSAITVEEQLTRLIDYRNASPDSGTVRQSSEYANTFVRVALNAGMLLTSVGTKTLGWLDPKGHEKAERTARTRRERGRMLLAGQLMRVGLARDIKVFVNGDDRPASGSSDGWHASPRTHWRRGHFRRQPYGPRENPLYRVVFIAPMLIGTHGETPEQPICQVYVDAQRKSWRLSSQ